MQCSSLLSYFHILCQMIRTRSYRNLIAHQKTFVPEISQPQNTKVPHEEKQPDYNSSEFSPPRLLSRLSHLVLPNRSAFPGFDSIFYMSRSVSHSPTYSQQFHLASDSPVFHNIPNYKKDQQYFHSRLVFSSTVNNFYVS